MRGGHCPAAGVANIRFLTEKLRLTTLLHPASKVLVCRIRMLNEQKSQSADADRSGQRKYATNFLRWIADYTYPGFYLGSVIEKSIECCDIVAARGQ